jgi:hypothetical protein
MSPVGGIATTTNALTGTTVESEASEIDNAADDETVDANQQQY